MQYNLRWRKETKLFNGVKESLESLRSANYRLFCLSASEEKFLIEQMKFLGIYDYFIKVCGGSNSYAHGIGDFGDVAYKFIDLLKEAKIKIWQVLPLNPVGYGNSPYQSECGEALDPIYISLDLLAKEGYFDKVPSFNKDEVRVDYTTVREYKEKYLRLAFKKEKDTKSKAFNDFVLANKWLENYAKFHIIFLKNNYLEWNLWDQTERYDCYKHENETNFERDVYQRRNLEEIENAN